MKKIKLIFLILTCLLSVVNCIKAQTNKVRWEIWKNKTSYNFSSLKTTDSVPDLIMTLDSINTPNQSTSVDHFCSRIRGYIIPPVSGSYSFYFACDNVGQFWLSSDTSIANAVLKNQINSAQSNWRLNTSNQTLVAGQKYFFEILHYDSTYTDLVKLGWKIPGADTNIRTIKNPYITDCGDNIIPVSFTFTNKKIVAYPNWIISMPNYVLRPWNTTNKNIIWRTSNSLIATVNTSGIITTKNVGSCFIVGKSAQDSTKKDTISLEVTNYYGSYFVKQNATTSGDGKTWGNAISLTSILDILSKGTLTQPITIYVAEGIYKPTNTIDRNISFVLNNTRLVGGFDSTSTSTDTTRRNINIHQTILSGEIGDTTTTIDNSYHVATIINSSTFDGVTIRDGRASAATYGYISGTYSYSPSDNGGGIYFSQFYSMSPININLKLIDCILTNNSAWNSGGSICFMGSINGNVNKSKLDIQNTVIYNNLIQQQYFSVAGGIFNICINAQGAGISASYSTVYIKNSSLNNNSSAYGYGKALYLTGGTIAEVDNCTFYKNNGYYDDISVGGSNGGATLNLNNSTIKGCGYTSQSIKGFWGTANIKNSTINGAIEVRNGSIGLTANIDNSLLTNLNISQFTDTSKVHVKYSILNNVLYGASKNDTVNAAVSNYNSWLDTVVCNNGGFMKTMRLKKTSNNPAKVKGNPLYLGTTDERGALRMDSVSIGAYQWVKPTGISITPNPITLNNGDSINIVVSVLPSLVSDSSYSINILNNSIATLNSLLVNSVSIGSTKIIAQANDNLITDTCIVNVINTVNTNEIKPNYRILIYPNPAISEITIETNTMNNVQLTICNLEGKEMIKLQGIRHKTQVDISSLPSGVYFIKVVRDQSEKLGGIFFKHKY